MHSSFFSGNRSALYESLADGTLLLLFAGKALHKSADEYYPLYASRNFVYLTGLTQQGMILLAEKSGGQTRETLFIAPPDAMQERWTGRRVKADEAETVSGISDIRFAEAFQGTLQKLIRSGNFETVALDLFKNAPEDQDAEAHRFARELSEDYPYLRIRNVFPQLRSQRTIKQPCEVEAIRKAALLTRDGITAMMQASRPGMFEYEYKAEFDRVLTASGVLEPAFAPIISAGKNNFCIHYNAYTGQAQDGDMVLNDVGAKCDGLVTDVSRGWPCKGRFSERQQLLYTCAYNTSLHMFETIRPGMPMASVDRLAREYNYEQLKDIGLCKTYDEIGTYMWHGGAHHIGWDTHDTVDMTRPVSPGMVFCVDIGIYCEAWGIGFRVEDNCLVTETGCENLTACVPKSIEDIEAVMRK